MKYYTHKTATELPLHLLSGSKQWHHTRFALPETQISSVGSSKEMKEAWLRETTCEHDVK